MSCPFLIENELRCKADIYRVVDTSTGKTVEYQPLTPNEADKCRDSSLFHKCPNFIHSDKETCPNCGHIYLPEDAVQVHIENETIPACPRCGTTQRRR